MNHVLSATIICLSDRGRHTTPVLPRLAKSGRSHLSVIDHSGLGVSEFVIGFGPSVDEISGDEWRRDEPDLIEESETKGNGRSLSGGQLNYTGTENTFRQRIGNCGDYEQGR